MNAPEPKDFRTMTADSVGRDILQALVTEIKLLPDPWPKLSKAKQDDIIDRLRSRVEHNVRMAVHLIASEGRTVVAGDLDQITIKDGVKAVVKFSPAAPNLHELYEVVGKAVLVVVANPADHTGGMDKVKGENDQRNLDLGKEYAPNSDGEGMPGEGGTVIDGEAKRLPAPGDTTVTDEERQQHYELGYQAAKNGEPESNCPIVCSELVIEWIRGHKAFHEEQAGSDSTDDEPEDDLYPQAVAVVRAEKKVSISMIQRRLMIGYNRAARLVDAMEAKGVISAADAAGQRTVLDSEEE